MNTVTIQPPSFTEFSMAGATYVDTIKNAYNSITYRVTISNPSTTFNITSNSSSVTKPVAASATVKMVMVPENPEVQLGSFANLRFSWRITDCRYTAGAETKQMIYDSDGVKFTMPANYDVTTQYTLTANLSSI